MEALQQTSIPARLRSNILASSSKWFTWSPAFRHYVNELRTRSLLSRRVRLIEVPECKPYGATYSTHLDRLSNDERRALTDLGNSLASIRLNSTVVFFRDLLAPALSSNELRVLFSMLREALIESRGGQATALYSPVTPERRDPGFNLHADLFLTTKLWLVFDDVPTDGTGASLLLPRAELVKIMRSSVALPSYALKEVTDLLDKPLRKDSFDRLYGLLHSETHQWCEGLNAKMKARVLSVEMHRGEGYLLDDRRWLHGRTAVSRSVSKWRFHRLTFGLRKAT